MISKNHQFPDPVDGPTKTYLNVRSSREYAEWLAALARTTRRSRQELVEYGLAILSEREGHPCGEPPDTESRYFVRSEGRTPWESGRFPGRRAHVSTGLRILPFA